MRAPEERPVVVPTAGTGRHVGVMAWLAIGWLALLLALSVLAPVLPIADPDASDVAISRQGPSVDAWLGGDASGRDVLARTVHGARSSLLIGSGAITFGFLVGGSLGLVAGYARGRIDTVVSTLFDVMLSVPSLVLALAFTAFFGGTVSNVILALGLVGVPMLGRITRASTLAWSRREFVVAARARGARPSAILGGEVLPNVLPAMGAVALLGVAVAIVAEGGLSLIGAGVQGGQITWGTLIAGGRNDLSTVPLPVLVPATAIFLTVLALNYLGDVVRERFDVRESML
jgi:peptide/nickel transport system permease protein